GPVVQGVLDLDPVTTDQGGGERPDVGEPTHARLQPGVRARDHVGIHAGTQHHQEHVVVLTAVAVGVADLTQVDGAAATAHRDVQRPIDVVAWDVEIAGQQVAGPQGDDAHRHRTAEQAPGDTPHRAVAAAREDQADALGDGLGRLPGPGVGLRRLVEQRIRPPVAGGPVRGPAADVVDTDFGGVEHDGDAGRGWGHGPNL